MWINDIPANAPLFCGASKEDLQAIIKHLHDASYHYADDSAREWGQARTHVAEAAKIVNRNGLRFGAMQAIQKEAKPMMPLDDLIDAVLADARTQEKKHHVKEPL